MSEVKRSWRDSNWYVNLTGFWREYKKHRLGILGIIVVIVFFGMAIFAPYLTTHNPNPTVRISSEFQAPGWLSILDSSGVVTGEFIEDPFLEQEPLIVVNGTSGEFSGVHQPITETNDMSYVNLTWTHTAGTELDFLGQDARPPLPDYTDMVYFEQDFTWPYNSLPKSCNISLSFGTTVTGDFANTSIGGNLMFRLYMWMVDSSGDWSLVYESREATYTTTILEKRPTAWNFFRLLDVFQGMIEVDGVQEDPTDTVRVVVGLAPTYRFDEYKGAVPWQEYSGSVTFTVAKLKMYAFGDYFGILGTTNYGGDVYSQIVYGSRISLTVGLLATGLSTSVGVLVGMVAGYFGGKVDEVLMRVVDFLLVIPGLPLMMVLAAFLGAKTENIIIVIAILGWTGTSRLIRSQVLAEKNKAYVESARAIGASDTYIMFRHILPNVTPILFANITLGVVGAILSEAGLSFLGLTSPEDPSWGRMLADARTGGAFTTGAWWVVLFPGLMITVLSLAFTFVGHTLDQVLNPRLRER